MLFWTVVSLTTLVGKPRRHIVTYSDTYAPGEAQGSQLPKTLRPGDWTSFRVHVGPALASPKPVFQIEGEFAQVRYNGEPELRPGASGYVVIDVQARVETTVHWVEIQGS